MRQGQRLRRFVRTASSCSLVVLINMSSSSALVLLFCGVDLESGSRILSSMSSRTWKPCGKDSVTMAHCGHPFWRQLFSRSSPTVQLHATSRTPKSVSEQIGRVEDFLQQIGGKASKRALKNAIPGVSIAFLESHFQVSGDGTVRSGKVMTRQIKAVEAFLHARGGTATKQQVLWTFHVTEEWLCQTQEFQVQGDLVRSRTMSSRSMRPRPKHHGRSDVQNMNSQTVAVEALGPAALFGGDKPSAKKAIMRIRQWLQLRANMPLASKQRELRQLMALWHPDLRRQGSENTEFAQVFHFLADQRENIKSAK